jgi:two-component sensor histidine kinase
MTTDDDKAPHDTFHQSEERQTLLRAEKMSRENEAWSTGQSDAFKVALNGGSLEVSLGALVSLAIAQIDPDLRCAFYIADSTGTELKHIAGMSESYAVCVDGFKIGPDSLACGLAFHLGQPVITPDVTKEPKWAEWRWLAEQHGYRACWSFPVETAMGKTVGTFALYFPLPREASSRDYRLAGIITRAAAIIIARQQEIDERTRAQLAERAAAVYQGLLLAELQHRVRNVIATIRSIASRSGREGGTVDDFKAHFDGRLSALARTQSVLTRTPESADLEMLVRDELLAQAAQESRYTIAGEMLRLPPKAAEVIALALHELATNANKYGALTQPHGRIDISWRTETRAGQSWLALVWAERGVSLRSEGSRREGFGTELITRRIPYELQGTGVISFTPTGVHAEVAFPLPEAHELAAARARAQRAAE